MILYANAKGDRSPRNETCEPFDAGKLFRYAQPHCGSVCGGVQRKAKKQSIAKELRVKKTPKLIEVERVKTALDMKIEATRALYLSALTSEWQTNKAISIKCDRRVTQVHFHMKAFVGERIVKKQLVRMRGYFTAYYKLAKSTNLEKD